MQAIFDFTYGGILAVDSEGVITNINKNAANFLQRPKDILHKPARHFPQKQAPSCAVHWQVCHRPGGTDMRPQNLG